MTSTAPPMSRRALLGSGGAMAAGAMLMGGRLTGVAAAASVTPAGLPGGSTLPATKLAGQRIIFSYPGLTPPASLLDQIRAGEAGGVIFFGENIAGVAQIAEVVAQLKEAQAASPVPLPLLLMTDQEGGLVRRLPGAPVLSEKQIGASPDPVSEARQAGTGAGANLAGVGMNLNLAPVLDVFRQPGDFDDQFQRSYSSDPALVAPLGAAFITAQQRTGVAATAKHFPGLGAATQAQNTDLGPVTLTQSRAELRGVDEYPFGAAIGAGVKLVMPSWAVYPALDAELPAGLSSTVLQGELRARLGFGGVIITDALEAGALTGFGDYAQRGVLAARAGADLLLCSARDVAQGQSTLTGLVRALERRRLDPRQFAAALERVVALRANLA